MNCDKLLSHLVEAIDSSLFANYLEAEGWTRVDIENRDILVYRSEIGQFTEILLPVNLEFADYSERVSDAIEKVADLKKKPALEIANEILTPLDRLSFRFLNDSVTLGRLHPYRLSGYVYSMLGLLRYNDSSPYATAVSAQHMLLSTIFQTNLNLLKDDFVTLNICAGGVELVMSLPLFDPELLDSETKGEDRGKGFHIVKKSNRPEEIELTPVPYNWSGSRRRVLTFFNALADGVLEILNKADWVPPERDEFTFPYEEEDPDETPKDDMPPTREAISLCRTLLQLRPLLGSGKVEIELQLSRFFQEDEPNAIVIDEDVLAASEQLLAQHFANELVTDAYHVGTVTDFSDESGRGAAEEVVTRLLLVSNSGRTLAPALIRLNPFDLDKAKRAFNGGLNIIVHGLLRSGVHINLFEKYSFFEVLTPINSDEGVGMRSRW